MNLSSSVLLSGSWYSVFVFMVKRYRGDPPIRQMKSAPGTVRAYYDACQQREAAAHPLVTSLRAVQRYSVWQPEGLAVAS
jgi:hypothetical protein